MKVNEEIMEILGAFDLTQSNEAAALLSGCHPKTVARYVAQRDCGNDPVIAATRDSAVDPYRAKIEEWVDHSNADIRADVCHDKLVAMGYEGSERTTRRAVAGPRPPTSAVTGASIDRGWSSPAWFLNRPGFGGGS